MVYVSHRDFHACSGLIARAPKIKCHRWGFARTENSHNPSEGWRTTYNIRWKIAGASTSGTALPTPDLLCALKLWSESSWNDGPVDQQSFLFLWWQSSQLQGRTGFLVSPIDLHFHDLCISISFLQVLVGQNACLCCYGLVCYVMMRKYLFVAWIKRKNRNKMSYTEAEQNN